MLLKVNLCLWLCFLIKSITVLKVWLQFHQKYGYSSVFDYDSVCNSDSNKIYFRKYNGR